MSKNQHGTESPDGFKRRDHAERQGPVVSPRVQMSRGFRPREVIQDLQIRSYGPANWFAGQKGKTASTGEFLSPI